MDKGEVMGQRFSLFLGYLLQIKDRRIAYVTDHEHSIGQVSPNVLEMALGVDLLIHDAQYSREELANGKRGWGHSAWEDVVELAREGLKIPLQQKRGSVAVANYSAGHLEGV